MKVGLIGCGVMGSAFARAVGKRVEWRFVGRKAGQARELVESLGGEELDDPFKLVREVECVVVAVKPYHVPQLLPLLSQFPQETLVISLVGGMKSAQWQELFPEQTVCRILPNLPIEVGEGVVGVSLEPALQPSHREKLEELLKGMGRVKFLFEEQLEALSALAGSGPGFAYLLLEAFAEAGIQMGLKSQEAVELACQTFRGAATQCLQSQRHPAELKWEVAAPGGTTIGGLVEMEKRAVRSAVIAGILETRKRAERPLISKEIKGS